jgi:hypothetical protein
MGQDSCTVAVDICEHHVTIHFKSDDQLRRIYVHPDNIVLHSSELDWSRRSGLEYTFHQNKFEARASIQRLCAELKGDRSLWGVVSPDDIMEKIYEEIGMSPTLWTSVRKWVRSVVQRLISIATQAIAYKTGAGFIGWL